MGKQGLARFGVVVMVFIFGLLGCATEYVAEHRGGEKVDERTAREWIKINYYASARAAVAEFSREGKDLEKVLKALEKIRKQAVAKMGSGGIPDETLADAAKAFETAGDLEQARQLEAQLRDNSESAAEKRRCYRENENPFQCDPSPLEKSVRAMAEAGNLEQARQEISQGDWDAVDRAYAWLAIYKISHEPKDLETARQLAAEVSSADLFMAISEVTGEYEDSIAAFESRNIDCRIMPYSIWVFLKRGGDLKQAREAALDISEKTTDDPIIDSMICRYQALLIVVRAFAKAGRLEEARQLADR